MKKHPGGRPTKYSPAMLQKSKDYIKNCREIVEEFHKTRGEKSDSYERFVKGNLPTIEGLSIHLEVNLDTLYEWATKHPEFSETLDVLRKQQKEYLIKYGLTGMYNPLMAKFILSANHGMAERSEKNVHIHGSLSVEDKEKIDKII